MLSRHRTTEAHRRVQRRTGALARVVLSVGRGDARIDRLARRLGLERSRPRSPRRTRRARSPRRRARGPSGRAKRPPRADTTPTRAPDSPATSSASARRPIASSAERMDAAEPRIARRLRAGPHRSCGRALSTRRAHGRARAEARRGVCGHGHHEGRAANHAPRPRTPDLPRARPPGALRRSHRLHR